MALPSSFASFTRSTATSTLDYTYDPLYRLTDASYSDGSSYGYTYDAAGNRASYGIDGSTVTTYTYNSANRLTQLHDLLAATVTNFSYDDNGNLLDDGEYSYSYDSANRLTQLADAISTINYEYNGDGVRSAQILDGLRTDYVQDIAAPLPQVLTARQGGSTSSYLQGLGLIGEEQDSGATPSWQYHLPDALGSVRQVVDAQGDVLLGRAYDPFGGIRTLAGTGSSAYGFAGEEQDATTEQLYLRARTYSPRTGRFLQQDSVIGAANQPRTLHRYAYSFNNPVNYTDPSGHMPRTGSSNSSGSRGGGSPSSGSVSGPQSSNPGRSANDGNWETRSDPRPKAQSAGHRGILCGAVGSINRLMAWGQQLTTEELRTAIGVGLIITSLVTTGGAAAVPILLGAGIGSVFGYGGEVWDNRQSGLSWWDSLTTDIDWGNVGQAAFAGAVSGSVAAMVTAALPAVSAGAGLGIKVTAVAGVELISGRLEQIAVNVVSGRHWSEDVLNPKSGRWWFDIGLDVIPGVGATLFKPALRGFKSGVNAGRDWWQISKRLDDYVTRGTPVNPINRVKAKIEPFKALASQIAKGVPGAPRRLLSIIRGSDRDGWKAFWQAGMQPDYVTRLNKFGQANNLEFGTRALTRKSLFWRIFSIPAKPLTVKTKTRLGIVRGSDGVWYRSDMDLGYIKNRQTGQLLSNKNVEDLLNTLNDVAAGKVNAGRIEFLHPTHWTYDDVLKLSDPHPGNLWVINNSEMGSGLVSKNNVQKFAYANNLGWPFDRSFGKLASIGADEWISGAGLKYTLDQNPKSSYNTRVQHVLGHTVNNPKKMTQGVFDDRLQTLRLVDEAWHKAHTLNLQPVVQKNGNLRYVVPMGRRIGYIGGKTGASTGHPDATHMLIIVRNTNEVVTAFPYRP